MVQSRNVSGDSSLSIQLTGEKVPTATYSNLPGTYTIPEDGLYFVSSSINSRSGGSTKFITWTRMNCGSNLIVNENQWASIQNYASNNFTNGFIAAVFYGQKGEEVALQVRNTTTGGSAPNIGIMHNTLVKRIF